MTTPTPLETRTLGRTGLTVTRFGAGGHFTNGPVAHEDVDRRVRELNHLLDLGVTYIDVQWDKEEEATAAVMKQRRDAFTVAWPLHGVNNQSPDGVADYIRDYCDDHRRRYGIDHVDILLWVGLKVDAEADRDLIEAAHAGFERVKADGFCDFWAFSCHHSPATAQRVIAAHDLFDVVMFPYSPLHPGAAESLLPTARQNNVGVVAMKNFGGGGGFFNKVFAGECDHPDVARWRGSSRPYEAAIRWVLNDDHVDTAVPAGHSIQQIDELHRAVVAGPHPDDEQVLATLRRVMIETETPVQLRGGIEAELTVWD